MLDESPGNDEDFPWHISSTWVTSYLLINLDLGMRFLFPNTFPHILPSLTKNNVPVAPQCCIEQLRTFSHHQPPNLPCE